MRISGGLIVSSVTLALFVAACDSAVTTHASTFSTGVPTPAPSTDGAKGTVGAKPASHAIGGTVSGLSGRGLVLQVNGGGDLAVDTNGKFGFPARFPKGADFGVTVKSQPTGPGQLCVLGGDSGTVGDADVRSVTVDCFTDRYVVGGTVSGVSGTGVVLQLNGGNDVHVSANGTFAFPTPLASQVLYSATVKTKPTSPAQTCVIANGLGMVQDGPVRSIAVTCRTDEYTLAGVTSGLVGSGLVLHNATSNEDFAVSADGPFKLAKTVPSRGSFDVSVKTQPAGPAQECTVSGGQGTDVGGDVSTLIVDCSTKSFAVGGTATGIANGVTLVVGGNTVPVTANGSFALGTFLSGTSYDVTLDAKPLSPSQTCEITHGSGIVAGANVTDVALACTTDAFTVGVTITGTTGNVELTNVFDSDSDSLPPLGNGSFVFTKSVPSGEAHEVAVKTAPAGQSCTVGGPHAETMGNGNVTGVTVTCVDTSHAVGGTVSGLAAGDTIELANGADTVALAADGSFTFPVKVNEGATFAVTVKTAPTTNRRCTITDGAATMGTTDVSNVGVSCVAPPPVPPYAGNYNDFGASGTYSSNYLLGNPVTITADGTLTGFGIVSYGSGTNYMMALYTDNAGKPDQLVAATSGSALTPGRLEVTVSGTPVTAGNYWILTIYQGTVTGAGKANSPTGQVAYVNLPYGSALPQTISNPAVYGGQEFNYYVLMQ